MRLPGRTLPSSACVTLLYDDWDRDPYPTPFGPIPHDLAVRLFYLNRPACWHFNPRALSGQGVENCPLKHQHDSSSAQIIIGRERDLQALDKLGHVEVLARSYPGRWDRTYLLARVQPRAALTVGSAMQSTLGSAIRR